MTNAILDKVPQALKSMYYAENELRRALFKGVMQRSDEARQHLAEARRHFDGAGVTQARAGKSAKPN